MDHRCPICGNDIAARRFSQPIIARAEIDCPFCKGRIRVNVHRAESALMFASFGGFVALGLLWYWLRHDALILAAFAAAMVGAALLPVIERFWLRAWPRYARLDAAPE